MEQNIENGIKNYNACVFTFLSLQNPKQKVIISQQDPWLYSARSYTNLADTILGVLLLTTGIKQ